MIADPEMFSGLNFHGDFSGEQNCPKKLSYPKWKVKRSIWKTPQNVPRSSWKFIGRTPKGAYSSRGRSRHLLETAFSEPLLRTLLRTLFYCKTHSRPPSQNPSENPFPRTLPRTFSEPFLERVVLPYDPLGVHPNLSPEFWVSTSHEGPSEGVGTHNNNNNQWRASPLNSLCWSDLEGLETSRIRFQRARFQTPSSVSFFRSEKNSPNIKFLGGIFLGHLGPRRRDIPDKNFMQVAFFCCFREWPGCPGIWVGTSWIWKNFMQENLGLIFRTLFLALTELWGESSVSSRSLPNNSVCSLFWNSTLETVFPWIERILLALKWYRIRKCFQDFISEFLLALCAGQALSGNSSGDQQFSGFPLLARHTHLLESV